MHKVITFVSNGGFFKEKDGNLLLSNDLKYLIDNSSIKELYKKIKKLEKRNKTKLFLINGKFIKARNVSGVVHFKKLTIQIFPKSLVKENFDKTLNFDEQILEFIKAYILERILSKELKIKKFYIRKLRKKFDSVFEAFVFLYSNLLKEILSLSMIKVEKTNRETVNHFSKKLDITSHVKNLGQKNKFSVMDTEFSSNILPNNVLISFNKILDSLTNNKISKDNIKRIESVLEGVDTIFLDKKVINSVKISSLPNAFQEVFVFLSYLYGRFNNINSTHKAQSFMLINEI